jgi:hypothetical protein
MDPEGEEHPVQDPPLRFKYYAARPVRKSRGKKPKAPSYRQHRQALAFTKGPRKTAFGRSQRPWWISRLRIDPVLRAEASCQAAFGPVDERQAYSANQRGGRRRDKDVLVQ